MPTLATVADPRPMTPALTPGMAAPDPGNLTVPPLFGWEVIVTGLVLLVLLAAVVFLLLMSGRAASGRAEWQAFLDGRSSRRPDEAGEATDSQLRGPLPR
ncbi:MAG: hypothetical protein JWQ45_1187 [Blastococcus sp.]|jgi:hypothetical protein|nr:hypothetical protein [Blastococcus sp.]